MADKNYLHTAYSNSADGTNGFTTVYPNLNLLDGTKDFSGSSWVNLTLWQSDGTYKGLVVKSTESNVQGLFQRLTIPEDGDYTFSIYVSATNALKPTLTIGKNGDALHYSQISSSPSDMTRIFYLAKGLKKGDVMTGRIENGSGVSSKVSVAGYKWEKNSTATPYMPSSSEVTTADWPKYVGTYVDTNLVSSTDPSKYVWDEMKYRVYLDGVPVGGSKLLSFDLENLKAGTTYNVQVNQINGNVESDKSESAVFKTTLTQ
ncbi:fibronectin type III domain-containing protein [Lactococcus petauri]|uniref:fibronectin type III domain-containing protein n=1 Tax=Lactococcus petauri TaxID=1940789 RepID=UPI003853E6EB